MFIFVLIKIFIVSFQFVLLFLRKMPLNCPAKFQFANEFGILRKEGVFSTIDVRNITTEDACPCGQQVQKLVLCENISKNCQKGVTTTLVDPETESQVHFPPGTIIHKWVIVDKTCGNLACELSFMAGYLSDCIEDETRLAVLAQRVIPVDTQATGQLVNKYRALAVKDTLNGSRLAAQKAIYDLEDAENGECVEDIDLGIVNGDNYVAEPKSLMPAITVTSGELCVGDLEFYICYTPPVTGTIYRPVMTMEACSPQRCGNQKSDCSSPSHRAGRSGCGGRGCH